MAAQEDTVRHGFQQGGGRGGDQLLAVRQHHSCFAQDALEEENVCDRHIAVAVRRGQLQAGRRGRLVSAARRALPMRRSSSLFRTK